ncbi:basic proline-rich protein-like [Stegostoma tigrinum]|uniref:basic proline-rich protein-like n=1 Tax=Stegostoma tigrinum TaxID=3053191 RepID=UPI00287062E3|nr:basic proline-rich protein-like [Stegostoma tigrinum]XP_048416029.2 basic proline-rich protein-like [Stegostoma tigrinum]XP_048416030.2 basic proline-rich protein-like [Stegostoma tigrinum]XP_048416031.2 basic proline-rich protein-like [Stegostoma tigrinum]
MDLTVTRKAAISWFTTTQAAKLVRGGMIPDWFHGIITRREAEELLKNKSQGCFLIRVGESRIGFSLSYRGFDRCRHFIIDVTTSGQYNITGQSIFHNSLQDLVNYHTQFPIDPYNECLTVPCRQLSQSTVHYEELCLFVPTKEVQSSPTPHSSFSSSNLEPSDIAPDRWTASLSTQESSGPRLPPRGNGQKLPPLPLPRRVVTDSKPTPETRTSSGGQPPLLPAKRLYPPFSQLTALSTEQDPLPAVTASDPRSQRNQPSSSEITMCHSNSEFKHQANDNLNSIQSNPVPPQRQPTDHPNPRPIPPQRQLIDHPNPRPIPPQRQLIDHPNPGPIPPQRQPIDHPNPRPIPPQRQLIDHPNAGPIPPQRQLIDHPNPGPIPPQRQPIDHPNPTPIPPQRQPIDHPNPRPIPPQRQLIDHPNPGPIPPQRQPIDHPNPRPIPPQRQLIDHPNPGPIPPQRQPIDHPNPRPIPPQRQPIDHPNPRPIPPQRQPTDHPNPRPIPPQRQPTDHMTDTKYTGESTSNMSHSDLLFPALNNSHHSPKCGQSLSQGQFMPHRHTICSRQFDEKETVEGGQLPTEGEVREQESDSFDLPIEYMTPPPYAPGY